MRALLVVAIVMTARVALADDPAITCKEAAPNSKLTASFKPDLALQDLVVWVAGFSCKNIVVAPDVASSAGKLTIVAPKPMTPKQALQLFVDAVEAAGLVVQQKPDTIVVKLGPNMPKRCPTTSAPTTGADLGGNPFSKKAPPTPPVEADDLDKVLAAGIKKIDETHYEVTSTVAQKMLANPMGVARGARVVPAMKDGKFEGFKLYAIRPSSLYARIGLANGDTVVAINGIALVSSEVALDAYQKLVGAKRLELGLLRRGKPTSLVITIK